MKIKKTNRRSPKRRSKKKKSYRIRNWREYNAALVQRGSLTVWLDETAVGGWHNPHQSGQRGASCTYSDSALICALTLQVVYHLPLRATEGLLLSLFGLLGLELAVPDFSTFSRRRKRLAVPLLPRRQGPTLHLVVDATGFKVGRPLGSAKASGKCASMAGANAAPGASCIWVLIKPPLKS